MKEKEKNTLLGYIFLIPSLIVFAIFMFYPLAKTIYLSFFDWNMIKPVKKFVGFANYKLIFADPNTYKIMGNTVAYIIILLLVNFIAPYILSFILSAVIKKGKNFYKAVFFLPSVISLVVGSILYTWILNPISGPVAIIAKAVGLTIPIWSKTEGWVIAVLSVITSWKVFGYNFIVILAGVSGVSTEVIEAAGGRCAELEDFQGYCSTDELCYGYLCIYYHHCAGTAVCVYSHQSSDSGRP